MTSNDPYQNFWESVNYGQQGDVEGLVWQKENGAWVMLIGHPQSGRVVSTSVQYDPWTGDELSSEVVNQ